MGEVAIRYLALIEELGQRVEGTTVYQAREAELAGDLDQLWARMTDDEHAEVERRLAAREAMTMIRFPDPSR